MTNDNRSYYVGATKRWGLTFTALRMAQEFVLDEVKRVCPEATPTDLNRIQDALTAVADLGGNLRERQLERERAFDRYLLGEKDRENECACQEKRRAVG